jgi:hypothetical protein
MTRRLNAQGYAIAEFGAAFAVLIMLMTALAVMAVIPVRFLCACGTVQSMVHRAALVEKRSLSDPTIASDPLAKMAAACGIEFGARQISIVCRSQAGGTISVLDGAPVPSDWLPNGANAPCTYTLQLVQPTTIKPLCSITGGLVGLNAPLNVTFSISSNWENLGCDPSTMEFYINE